jgi:hypothetical protein
MSASAMAMMGDPPIRSTHVWPFQLQTPCCPNCGRPYWQSWTPVTITTTTHTAPLTFSPERVERWALDQGKEANEAMRPEEV